MTGLLPVIFALTIIDTSRPDHGYMPASWAWWWLVFGLSLATWTLITEGVARLLARYPERALMERWDDLAHGLMLAWLGWICFGLHWTGRVDAYTPAILPWVVMQTTYWWCLATGARHAPGEGAWDRYRLIGQQMRFGMLPVLTILPVFDVCNWLTLRTGFQGWMISHVGLPITMTVATIALGVASLVLMPMALAWLWGAVPMPEGGMLRELREACARMQVGVRGILLWPTEGIRVYNAAVIGVLPQLRYVLFSQDLINDFPPSQVRAVLGHELGHARHRHLVLYLLFALATLMVALLLADPLTTALGRISWCARWPEDVRKCVITLALVAVKWRLIFGFLSRACERQADLAGADLAGSPLIMCAALRSVARYAGQAVDAPSWRHYSISQRAAFLERAAADPTVVARHHRVVRTWWCVLAALDLVLAAVLAIIAQRALGHR